MRQKHGFRVRVEAVGVRSVARVRARGLVRFCPPRPAGGRGVGGAPRQHLELPSPGPLRELDLSRSRERFFRAPPRR